MAKILRASMFCVLVLVLSAFSFTYFSNASVLISDMNVARNEDNGLNSSFIDTGSISGNYEIVICGTDTEGENPFFLPTPGSWNELNNSTCDGPVCQMGIWAREISSAASEEINCSWQTGTTAFVAATVRYSSVDTDNPIIDMACSEFVDGNYIVDPVSSEPGAQLLNIQLTVTSSGSGEPFVNFDSTSGLLGSGINFGDGRLLILGANTNLDSEGIGFPGVEFPPLTDIFNTKICVITLRMAKLDVPTLNEWGLIAMSIILGIAGLAVLRRKSFA